MPPQKATKTRNTANQHDKRHETGLAPPGKRVARQRSNGQLNAQTNGKAASAVLPPALPSVGLNQGFKFPRPVDTSTAETASARDHAAALENGARDRTPSNASTDDVGPGGDMADGAHEYAYVPAVEVPSAAACKNNPTHAGSTLSAVSTILAYYPLRDAISILILLLSLPPTLVLVIQTLFASLTFVPPTAGLSLSTLPNIKEMFNSSNFGYPALATILSVDILFYICWLPFWKSVQAVLLDLSQVVIAVSLSGAAASSTSGPMYSIATCTTVVCVVHVLRYKAIHLTALDYLRSVLHKMDIGIPLDAPSFATSFHSSTPLERGMAFTAIRTILGIHIVSQGITTCVRRTLANAKANEKDQNVPAIIKTDTETAPGTELPLLRSNPGTAEGPQPSHASSSTDCRPPGQPPTHRESKVRESSSKKKRKQANQVRSQQPLWAAIASTKVTFVKEMEQRDAADDAREATCMDNNTTNVFVSATNTTTDRIWVCEVRDTEIYFAVELSPEAAKEGVDGKDESDSLSTAIDRSKPFYVRVNGAAWSSTRIMSSEESEQGADDRYVGEVFGLAPLSSYHCEIVSFAKQRVLCSASLITQPAPTAEQAAAAPAPPQHQALRPSSPITTLKQSIQSAEAKLNDTRNRSKKSKKDQRAAHADIKKEINLLRSKLDTSGGVDDKQERRLLQISQHKNQAEEATADLKTQLEALGEVPSDELAQSQVRRRAWQSALDTKKAADRELDNCKAELDRELAALRSDIGASENKKERLATRNSQRAQELEKLTSKQQADMTAKQKRDLERAQVHREREAHQNQARFLIESMETEAQMYNQKGHEIFHQASSLSNWSTQLPPGYPGYSSPPTPEGTLPGQNGQVSPQANGPQPYSSPFLSHPLPVNNGILPRGRSSSMLSQYSGFTDNGDDYVFSHQHSWPAHTNTSAGVTFEDRKASDGDASRSASGSGSASGGASLMNGSTNGSNSPRPSAKPFVPGAAAKSVGTIGPPSKKMPP